jgi:CrcB protein
VSEPGPAQRLVWVGLGSGLGGTLRWALSEVGGGITAVFLANAIGAFGIGLYAAMSGPAGFLNAGPRQRLFVMPGLLAGLTSFSLFGLQTDMLLDSAPYAAFVFVLASLFSWAAGVAAGHGLALRIKR